MRQQRRLYLGSVDVFQRRATVPDDGRIDLGGRAQGQERQGPTHAKAGDADFAAAGLQELHGTADILRGGIAEVQCRHQVMRFFRVERRLAAEKVGYESDVPRVRQTVGDAADLIVDPPPLLDHHDGRSAGRLLRLGQVAVDNLPIRALECDCCSHLQDSFPSGSHTRMLTWLQPLFFLRRLSFSLTNYKRNCARISQ